VGDLLVHRDLEVVEPRVAQPVHVEEEVVEVDPLRTVGGTRWARGQSFADRLGTMPLDRLGMVLVVRPVVGATVSPYEGRVEVGDRVVPVRVVDPARPARFAGGGDARPIEPVLQVGVYRAIRVLEVVDRSACDVLDDRLQVPAPSAPGRSVGRRAVVHAGGGAAVPV
jgi:hypothetical protein